MLKLRLSALEHPTPDTLDCNDRKTFASTVLWLEDQKIRIYKIEDREGLRKVDNLNDWEKAYNKYKYDIHMPKFSKNTEELTWLLSYAIKLEYQDSSEKYKLATSEAVLKQNEKSVAPSMKAENFFDNMDFNNPEFITGVRVLASQLSIPHHPNHLLQLEAAAKIIHERIGPKSKNREIIEGTPFPFEKGNDVVSADDPSLDLAIRILRLIQIHKLRDLQTKINEIIVSVQNITADPKTDTKLGKVGY